MIRFERVPEPVSFDEKARQPGNAWLAAHLDTPRPRDYWTPFKPQLAAGFGQLCAYSAMYEGVGTVDHYRSLHTHPELAYEWSNYRFASAWINSCKGDVGERILDPFEVEDGWFEILLPSLQLVLTDAVPELERPRAELTLRRLRLRNDVRVIRLRQAWYQMYLEARLSLEGLRQVAPLLARAIERQFG